MIDLNITIIQSNLHWENMDANLKMFSQKISSIKEKTDLIVLPEMFSTGFTMNNKAMAEPMYGKTVEWMKKKAKEKNCVITGSLIIEEKKKFYNRLVWMLPDGKFKIYDKRHLFRYAGEEKYYSAGKKKLIVELKGWKICPMICYDLRFPVWIRNRLTPNPSPSGEGRNSQMEYDVLLFVANWPERRNHPWKTLLMARAMENQAYIVGVNRIGNDGNNVSHSGDSAVINYKGESISKTKAHEESIETITLSKGELDEWRKAFPAWMDADQFTV
ncbi:MAG: amidohydrolase [Bacteroidetes bacterium]|nr:MAG: amidohydrolase [Bacteroidota bacterium]